MLVWGHSNPVQISPDPGYGIGGIRFFRNVGTDKAPRLTYDSTLQLPLKASSIDAVRYFKLTEDGKDGVFCCAESSYVYFVSKSFLLAQETGSYPQVIMERVSKEEESSNDEK